MTRNNATRGTLRRGLLLALALSAGPLGANPPAPDISGVWDYSETSLLVLKPEDETIHVSCFLPDGVIVINQVGATFTGTLTHFSTSCVTKDGIDVPPPWPLPYEAFFSGSITGNGLHIDQFDAPPAPPIHCPKQGSIDVAEGVAVGFRTTGRCDLSGFPFPFKAKNHGDAIRP